MQINDPQYFSFVIVSLLMNKMYGRLGRVLKEQFVSDRDRDRDSRRDRFMQMRA